MSACVAVDAALDHLAEHPCSHVSWRRKFEARPGDLDALDVRMARFNDSASASPGAGLRLAAFAEASATFVDQSPCSGTRGRSSTIPALRPRGGE
jgi:hypothetical protein